MKINKLLIMISALSMFLLPLQNSNAEDDVYGWEMMTEQERIEHRNRMRNFETDEEREQYRIEHHERMRERAEERGLNMPEMPQNRMRDGNGMGRQGGGR